MAKLVKKESSTSAKSAKAKKPAAISKAPKGKSAAKADNSKKKVALSPKRSTSIKESKASNEKTLDLCLILDCTGSMGSWIERAKDTLKTIVDQVKSTNKALKIRVAFVGYRDFGDREQFGILDFSENMDDVKQFISK